MKTELWNSHEIRFVEVKGEWWAVLKDIADALELQSRLIARRLRKDVLLKHPLMTMGGLQESYIVSEFGIYDAVFQSRKKEAEEFRYWVYEMLKTLRQSTGLEGFQIFRMLDKEHQKEAMAKLSRSLREPVRVDFIKCNTIANKAVSTKYGYPKMIKKADMTPEMLVDREDLLEDTVELMGIKEKYHLELSVSEEVYKLAVGANDTRTA